MTTIKGKFTIASTDEDTEDKLSILYRGQEKTGKTFNMATFPKPFFIYADKNISTIRKFPNLDYSPLENYGQWHDQLLPELLAGTETWLKAYDTLAIDSLSALFRMCKAWGEYKNYKGFDLWGYVLTTFVGDLELYLSLGKAAGREGKPTYHTVASVHEQEIMDDAGALLRIGLAIQGQSAGQVAPLFDSVFCTESTTKKKMTPGQPPETAAEYFIYTVSPDRFRKCGDGIGGGKYKTLPTKMQGTYPDLMKAWGMS